MVDWHWIETGHHGPACGADVTVPTQYQIFNDVGKAPDPGQRGRSIGSMAKGRDMGHSVQLPGSRARRPLPDAGSVVGIPPRPTADPTTLGIAL